MVGAFFVIDLGYEDVLVENALSSSENIYSIICRGGFNIFSDCFSLI